MSLRICLATLPLVLAACGGDTPQPVSQPQPHPSATSVASNGITTAPKAKPKLGTFGVDLAGMDASTKPGKDFYQYAGGRWMKENQIPSDRSRWGMFDSLREEADGNVRKLLEDPAGKGKANDFYATYVDTKAIDAKGFAPAKAGLDAIDKLKSLDDVVAFMGRPDVRVATPIELDVSLDQKNPDRYIVEVDQGGLGLPDREYYSKKDAQFVEIRAKYEAHIAKVLAMAGDKKAAANAKSIVAVETKIAEASWPIADRRERDKTYNPRTLAELQKDAPSFPWKAYLDAEGYGKESGVIVSEVTAIPKIAQIFSSTPVTTWKAYLTYHFLKSSADVLPSELDKEVFDFYGHTLNGQPEQRERWKRGVQATNSAVGDAVGELYVSRFFKPKAKEQMDQLVENLRKAYGSRIEGVDWMTPETKKLALEKLASFRPKIGYPTKWKDYGTLEVTKGDAYGNTIRARAWKHEYMKAKLGKPSDRDEWFMTPQTVNAYYNSVFNEIVFPAAILQPPFFDPDADAAVNYGAIGAVIGHEMGHGFDDQGAKSDAKGVLRNWWAPADVDAFKKRTAVLADQYSEFEPLPGTKVNGRLTLGENIGDVGGSNVAYRAYKMSLDGKPAAAIDGYTGDQRFFLGYAQVWRSLYRDQALRNQVMTDPHSPAMYRVNGVVRNHDAWYEAFDVKAGDPLYLAPEKRVKIW